MNPFYESPEGSFKIQYWNGMVVQYWTGHFNIEAGHFCPGKTSNTPLQNLPMTEIKHRCMNTDSPVSVSWQSEHETSGITLLDMKIHADFNIEMRISILKCALQFWNQCRFQYWNVNFKIEVQISILKWAFQYWNVHFNFEINADFNIEMSISKVKCRFQYWNGHFNIEMSISILKSMQCNIEMGISNVHFYVW